LEFFSSGGRGVFSKKLLIQIENEIFIKINMTLHVIFSTLVIFAVLKKFFTFFRFLGKNFEGEDCFLILIVIKLKN
jgi:hypothetical protein